MLKSSLPILDYNYSLPEERIAKFPLSKRDATKLLVLNNKEITDSNFFELPKFIPENSILIFNNTLVIKARLVFQKSGGSRIEIFCLEEISSGDGYAIWKCYVGNSKRWKQGVLLMPGSNKYPTLIANRQSTTNDVHEVRFEWNDNSFSFNDILNQFGKVPLPPYLNREPVDEDLIRYQTIYAKYAGSVAAPTAGLHFTPTVTDALQNKNILLDYITLHVGAGTFKPVTADDARYHNMHGEKIIINKDTLLRLIQNLQHKIIAVGTTSMRSLESIYWLGYQLMTNTENSLSSTGMFSIDQWEPYGDANAKPKYLCDINASADAMISTVEALQAVYNYMRSNNLNELSGVTRIMIVPGYRFRICKALITNFHQPQSTLLLLVAAFIGEHWKELYNHALENDFRFLSYGDSCLLMP